MANITQWKVRTISGSSGGIANYADVNLNVIAPGYTVDRVAALTEAAPDLLAALESAIPALMRLGDFVGNVDEGGASGLGRIDRCALIGSVRAALARAKGE